MPCPKTRHLLTEYFDESLSALAREEIERHLTDCDACAAELDNLLSVQATLDSWHEQRVPHWDRVTPLFREEHASEDSHNRGWLQQWLPTAVSFAMLVLLLFNVSITTNGSGFAVTFGSPEAAITNQRLNEQLIQFAEQQRQGQEESMQLFMARVDERQDSNNLRLLQAVMEQTQQLTAENFEQIYTYFEQQRQLDMENLNVSYQQLMDSDFETLRTMEQLASYVQFQGEIR